jgi:cytochrome oxidase Cu insertion factor (SCO1/SenC/PrrC family)
MSSSASGGRAEAGDPVRQRRRGRRILFGILAVCAIPVVAGYVAYFVFPTAGRVNYGELLETKPLPPAALATLEGAPYRLDALRGKWILLHADTADCAPPCQAKLFNMRQARLAQGKDMDRIERVWIVLDAGRPGADLARLVEGAVVVRSGDGALVKALPAAADVRDHVYLVDPLGNLVLRFPKDADPKRMIKDLQRLLKYSGIG